jgi:hypothetical protein
MHQAAELHAVFTHPRYPRKDFDVFMQPLVEDLQKLWKSVSTRDVLQPEAEPFKLHYAVLYCTHDYPSLGIMSSRVTSGYNACVHCDKEQISKKLIHKVGFFFQRRFLPKNHPNRRNTKKLQFVGSSSDLDSLHQRSSVQRS